MKLKITLGLLVSLLLVMVPVSSLSVAKEASTDEVVVLTSSNTILLNAEVDGDSVSKAINQAKKLDSSLSSIQEKVTGKKRLYLFLNTPGGSIQAGLELIEAMNGLEHKVTTITLFAASMGWQIAQNLGDRYILKSGTLMSHHAAGEFQGSFGGVHPSQLDSRYQFWLERVKELDLQTVKRTNGKQTYESYTTAYDHEMWLTGTQSVASGYADRVVTVRCDSSLNGTSSHQADFMGIPITYDLDNCPMNTSPQNIKIGALSTGPVNVEYSKYVKQQFLTQFALRYTKALPIF